jgi:nucleoside-diphosphate-sugar epimerase
MRVVITGGAGVVGSIIRAAAPGDWDVVALDRRGKRPDTRRVDVTRGRPVRRAVQGADAVIHLAGASHPGASWRQVVTSTRAARVVLEAAAEAGVGRVVVASSNRVMGGYERDEPYASIVAGRTAEVDPRFRRLKVGDPVRPDSRYAAGKVAIEGIARYVAETTALRVVCLRLGLVSRDDRPKASRDFVTMLSSRDLVQLVRRAVEAPVGPFSTFFGVSANTWRIWDIDDAAVCLGYEPADDAERWR